VARLFFNVFLCGDIWIHDVLVGSGVSSFVG